MKIQIENVQRKEIRSRVISIRTLPSYCKWMAKNNVSPSKVFNETIKALIKENK